jgi:hypothetical protein
MKRTSNNFTLHKKQQGLTFIELSISIAVGLTIIITVAAGIRNILISSDVADAVTDVNYIIQGAVGYRANRPSYAGITMAILNTSEYLPTTIGAGTAANPWGGNYTVAVNSGDSSKMDITITNVPTGVSTRLESVMEPTTDGGNSAVVSGTTLTLTY